MGISPARMLAAAECSIKSMPRALRCCQSRCQEKHFSSWLYHRCLTVKLSFQQSEQMNCCIYSIITVQEPVGRIPTVNVIIFVFQLIDLDTLLIVRQLKKLSPGIIVNLKPTRNSEELAKVLLNGTRTKHNFLKLIQIHFCLKVIIHGGAHISTSIKSQMVIQTGNCVFLLLSNNKVYAMLLVIFKILQSLSMEIQFSTANLKVFLKPMLNHVTVMFIIFVSRVGEC